MLKVWSSKSTWYIITFWKGVCLVGLCQECVMEQAHALICFSILRFCSLETRKKEAGTPAPFLLDSHSDQIPSSMELDASRLFSPTVCHVMPTTALWGEQDRRWHPFSRCGSRGREGKRLAGYHRGWD